MGYLQSNAQGRRTQQRRAPVRRDERTIWERFGDEFADAASRSLVGGAVRAGADFFDWKKREGETEEQHDRRIAQAERNRRARADRVAAADPALREGDTFGNITRGGTQLLGQILGGADPTYLIAPGGTALARIAAQGAVAGASDIATQGIEQQQGVIDDIDWDRVGTQAAFGTLFQGGVEGIGGAARRLRNRGSDAADAPEGQDLVGYGRNEDGSTYPQYGEVERRVDDVPVEEDRRVVDTTMMERIPSRTLVERTMQQHGLDPMQAVNRARQELNLGSSRRNISPQEQRIARARSMTMDSSDDDITSAIEELDDVFANANNARIKQAAADAQDRLNEIKRRKWVAEGQVRPADNADLGVEETFARFDNPGVETTARVYNDAEAMELIRRRQEQQSAPVANRMPEQQAASRQPIDPDTPRDPNGEPEAPLPSDRRVGSIGPNQGVIPENLQHVANPEKTPRSRADTRAAGEELGITPDNFDREGRIGDVSAVAARGARVVEESGQGLLRTYDEFGPGSDEYLEALVAFSKAVDVHSQNSSELGRGLNILNREGSAKRLRSLVDIANDPAKSDQLAKLIEKYRDDPDALAKIGRDMRDPTIRDRIFSLRYNMMLSGPKTHFYNIVGSGGHILTDIATHGVGYLLDTPGRLTGRTDVITGREVAARIRGLITGARSALPNVRQAFREGRPLDGVTRDDMNRRVDGWELATKAMSAEDEFFRTAAHMSSLYGLATRKAYSEGLTGSDLDNRVAQLVDQALMPKKIRDKIDDPAVNEIVANTTEYAKRMRFQDEPSVLGKMFEGMRTRKKGDTPLNSLAKDGITLILPFVRTPDSLARTALRYSPLGVFEGRNIADWKAGGARRKLAEARVIMGTGVVASIAMQVLDGKITGEGPRDYKKRQTLEESGDWQSNSIKVGDQWYSYEGMEPLSIILSGTATTMERWNEGSSEGYLDQAGQQVFNAAEVLTNQSWTEGLADFFDAMTAPEAQRGAAMDNFFANIASSFVVPAIARQINQSYVDPVVRDTRGDDSIEDRIINRTMSGIPGLSDNLPAQHDALGREITRGDAFGPDIISRAVSPGHGPDPVSSELRRLMDTTGKSILERVDKSLNTKDFPMGRLTALEQQNYQLVTGTYFTALMEAALASPEYQAMDDLQREEYIRKAATQARKWAREEVFSEPNDEPVDEGNEDASGDEGDEFTFGIPTSMRRTEAGNRAVGGVENSAHLTGDGIDFVPAPGVTWNQLVAEARKFFPGAKVVFEGDHVHVELSGMDAPLYGERGTI